MTEKLHIEAQLTRLLAAFPTFKMPAQTRGLYVEKLESTSADDFGPAVESFIESGKKFPSIGDLIERAKRFRSSRLARESQQREGDWFRIGAVEKPDWGKRFDSPLHRNAFERGRARILDRGWTSTFQCPCMQCQFRRLDGVLNDSGPVEDHLREAHQTLGRP